MSGNTSVGEEQLMILSKKVEMEDLVDLGKIQGKLEGRWATNSMEKEYFCREYLDDLIFLAKKHGAVIKDLEDFRMYEEDEDYRLMERLGYDLFTQLKPILLDKFV